MKRRAILLGAFVVLIAGCGGGKSHSSTTQAATAPAATATTSPPHPPSKLKPGAAPPVRHRPSPAPKGPPPPPAGLRATTGYDTYELCSGGCSGSVPTSLRRPLRAPSGCSPRASGPVTPRPATSLTTTPFIGSPWRGGRVTWSASGYSGPILIRGRQISGSGAVGFGEGHVPYDELQLQGSGPWQTFTRVQSSGCYFYQVDGTSFSSTTVFRAS